MPNEETSPSLKSPEAKGRESLLSFRDFLKAKADELDVRDRHRRRGEWLGAIHRLLDQIRDWLRESDPEGVLDIEPYEVSRTEQNLGTYDAPALKIRLGAGEVDVRPIGREVPFMANRAPQATPRNSQAASISRMDIGNTIFTEKSIKVKTCGKSAMSETGLPT